MFALEISKNNFKIPLWFFDAALHEQEKMNDYIERHMYEAIENGEFELYLQPKIDLKTNSLASAEALVRWIRNDGTTIFPSQFIPIFEQNGFCVNLDMYMDDFGTGYSSLNTLGKLNIDELKLDRSFLVEIKDTRNQNARLIMEEIVQLSKKLSIFSVIEGVETSEDDLLVKEIGCDYGQGYYYSRPIDSNDFTSKMLNKFNK